MAKLISCFKKPKGGDNSTKSQDPNGRGQQTLASQEVWRVVFDGYVDSIAIYDDSGAVAAGLPQVGQVYGGLYCSSVRPQRTTESPYVWDVYVDLVVQQPPTIGGGQVFSLNIRKSTVAREETAIKDRLGLPLVNTFGELLPQLPNNTLYDALYTITWQTTVKPDWDEVILGKTNSDAFTFTICGVTRSFAKSQVKCTAANWGATKYTSSTSGDTSVKTFTYDCELQIQVRKPKWVWTAPNEGYRGYNGSDQEDTFRDPPDDPQGTPRTSPTKLDLEAHELPPGSTILKLPDDAIGKTVPSAGRDYDADGAFELDSQVPFGKFFATLIED